MHNTGLRVSAALDKLLLVPAKNDARTFDNNLKWLFTAIVSLASAVAPLGSAMLMPALPDISTYFHVAPSIANLSVALYALSMAIVPLWWSVLSEMYGRRPVYIVSFALFITLNSAAAVSQSITSFIVTRLLAGGASASVAAVGAGTIADLWAVENRGNAMGYYFLGPMVGPLVSPILGGILTQRLGWRSTQWGAVVYGGLVWLLVLLALPETSAKILEKRRNLEGSDLDASKSFSNKILHILVEPFKVVGYLRFPSLLMTTYYTSVTFASYYMLNIAIQSVFSQIPYSFRAIILGLLYIPGALGSILASVVGGRWSDYIMRRQAERAGRYDADGKPMFLPADRMQENAWLAGILFPAALLAFGWIASYSIHWIVPCILFFFFGFGNSLIFNLTTTMLTEILPGRASHGVALNNLMRNTLSCVAAVVTEPLIKAIGVNWLFTGVAIICWASSVVIWAMQKRSEQWAARIKEKLTIA